LEEVDGGVWSDLGTREFVFSVNCTILAGGDSRDVDHTKVASRHELDSHVLPDSRRVCVSQPCCVTGASGIEDVSGTGLTWGHVCDDNKGCCESQKRGESVRSEHFSFSWFKKFVMQGLKLNNKNQSFIGE